MMNQISNYLYLDVEADGLYEEAKNIWVIVAKVGGDIFTFNHDNMDTLDSFFLANDDKTLVGHNIINYDIPVIEKILGVKWKGEVEDTLILSRFFNPSRKGGHSLSAWGERLNFPKTDFNEFRYWSKEMEKYCINDVLVTEKLHKRLSHEGKPKGLKLEHQVAKLISDQEKNGWLFDEDNGIRLLQDLKEKLHDIEDEVRKVFPPIPKLVKEITPRYKKDGGLSKVGLNFMGDDWNDVGGRLCRVDYLEFNLGSRQQISQRLVKAGWRPTKRTDKGNIIVDENILRKVKIPEAQLIADYLMIQKRIAMIQSWFDNIKEDGRVHGSVNTIGAVTGRMTHNSPNMAQVVAGYSPYGKEMRSLWTVPIGSKLVGVDASGIELRMLSHYMQDKEYEKQILDGDIHTFNQKLAGLETRDRAKTFIYALIYGAGNAKIGEISKGTAEDGKRLRQRFLRNLPALKSLIGRVQKASQRGYLKGLDGRKIWVRSPHSALNALFQSSAAVVMKKALTLLDEYANIEGIPYKLVGNIHDEIQTEVKEEDAVNFGKLAVRAIEDAGVELNVRIKLAGEYKIGVNWYDTH